VRPKLERAWAARFAEQVVSRALDNEANIVVPREVDGRDDMGKRGGGNRVRHVLLHCAVGLMA
jgi:hypothetical protein